MCFNTAAVRQQFPTVSEEAIKLRIGQFLAQSQDRDGGRKERELRRSAAAAISASAVDTDNFNNSSNNEDYRCPTPPSADNLPTLPSLS
jgi:hypothetical protein